MRRSWNQHARGGKGRWETADGSDAEDECEGAAASASGEDESEPAPKRHAAANADFCSATAALKGLIAPLPEPEVEVAGLPPNSFDSWSKTTNKRSAKAPPHRYPKQRAEPDNLEEQDCMGILEDLRNWRSGKCRQPCPWVMMEKYDGFNYSWDGERFSTKNGNQRAEPPKSLEPFLPSTPCDGEVWAGRDHFDKVFRTEWPNRKYVIWDTRHRPQLNFTERLADVRAHLEARDADRSQVEVAEALHVRCAGACLESLIARDGDDVKVCEGFNEENPGCPAEFLMRVVEVRGEGIILHRNTSWRAGKHRDVRSSFL